MKLKGSIAAPRTRRNFIGNAAAAGASLAVGLHAPAILAQSKAPIRIGLLNTFSGVIANSGEDNWAATQLYFDKINWTIAGRKVEVIREDDQFNPQVGLQKIRKLVESDKVDLVVGPQASNVAMAILNYTKQSNTFLLVAGAGTSAITWERIPYMFRSSISGWQLSHSIADWCYDTIAKEIVLAASDYAGGRDVVSEFRTSYVKKGGKVMKEIYPPLGTTDFSPYMADMRALNAPVTYNFFVGSDAVRYVKQYAEMGIKGRKMGFAGIVDPTTFEGQGDAALGWLCAMVYTDTLDNPENKAFVAAYREKTKIYPTMYAEYGYTAAQTLDETIKATGGDVSKEKLAAAMAKVQFKSVRGPFRMDPVTHNPIQDVYVTEVQKVGDRLANMVVHTVKDVRDPGVKET